MATFLRSVLRKASASSQTQPPLRQRGRFRHESRRRTFSVSQVAQPQPLLNLPQLRLRHQSSLPAQPTILTPRLQPKIKSSNSEGGSKRPSGIATPVGRGGEVIRPSSARPTPASSHPSSGSTWLTNATRAGMEATPGEMVDYLNQHVVGQRSAKRAVANALRNRWRRLQLQHSELAQEIHPKNILMVGPTGVGKTEIARRLSKGLDAPFVKVEATKFTELGYVGRDVDEIIEELVSCAHRLEKVKADEVVRSEAERRVDQDIIRDLNRGGRIALPDGDQALFDLRAGKLDHLPASYLRAEKVTDLPSRHMLHKRPPTGDVWLNTIASSTYSLKDARRERIATVIETLSEAQTNPDALAAAAVRSAEEKGIVFIDEIDKICAGTGVHGQSAVQSEISSAGVQRDLLPLIEGCSVRTESGIVNTDHILFIASGSFHGAHPTDLMPELQGRLPVRIDLDPLTRDDFHFILTHLKYNLIEQQIALFSSEGVKLTFTDEAIRCIADHAEQMNREVANLGARRLHTVLERVIEDLSFSAPDQQGQEVVVDESTVMAALASSDHLYGAEEDYSKFII